MATWEWQLSKQRLCFKEGGKCHLKKPTVCQYVLCKMNLKPLPYRPTLVFFRCIKYGFVPRRSAVTTDFVHIEFPVPANKQLQWHGHISSLFVLCWFYIKDEKNIPICVYKVWCCKKKIQNIRWDKLLEISHTGAKPQYSKSVKFKFKVNHKQICVSHKYSTKKLEHINN